MNEYDKFFNLLRNYKFLVRFWDAEKRECKVAALNRAMLSFSSGELVVAQALLSIWRGTGVADFIDFTNFALLDAEARKPLADWLLNPFFP